MLFVSVWIRIRIFVILIRFLKKPESKNQPDNPAPNEYLINYPDIHILSNWFTSMFLICRAHTLHIPVKGEDTLKAHRTPFITLC
jgi:hypothetical protein